MNNDIEDLQTQIQRCRRIASMMTDEEVRQALEALAVEYESRLPRRGAGFMLQPSGGENRDRRSSNH